PQTAPYAVIKRASHAISLLLQLWPVMAFSLKIVCTLSAESSQRRCKTPDGLICSGRGECDCGACICQVAEPGNYYGPRCECHDWVCATYDGKTCGGHGVCHCGKCECDEDWFGEACQYQEDCNLTNKKSKELCRNPQGVVCSNAGSCHCGSCMCHNPDGRGLVTGRFCECDDSECLDEDTGEVCGGHGQCYCGNCYCAAGWHGDKCELQCDISPWESKRRCTSPDGKICSNRGTCICGECTCYDVDPSGDWGDVHGDTCECDERSCHATYDRYSDDFCSGETGWQLAVFASELQVPWRPHHQQTNMFQLHQDFREEGTTKHFQESEKIWHGSPDPQKVLQLHHREHPNGLQHCLALKIAKTPATHCCAPTGSCHLPCRCPLPYPNVGSCHYPLQCPLRLLPCSCPNPVPPIL
uniref:Integrin beta-like protein 1 n=1 Tax=Hucho hucho TaxID=62062 RepID=A0A4W5PET1_9TELE